MPASLDPKARAEFLELIKELCDLVPDRNLGKLEMTVRKLLPPEVEAELTARLTEQPVPKRDDQPVGAEKLTKGES